MKQRPKNCRGFFGLTIANYMAIVGSILIFSVVLPILSYSQTGVSRPTHPSADTTQAAIPLATQPASPRPSVPTLFNQMTIMPYITGSLNFFSGMAFPEPASGAGIGGGLSFDMTKEGQKMGLMFDFAFQDMSGYAANGSYLQLPASYGLTDTVTPVANAYHYWYYLVFEPYLKLQGKARNGYFIIGASFGMAILGETVNKTQTITQFIDWDNSPYGNIFRFDIRAGIGVKLADIGTHELILEARAGYPLTNVISNFPTGSGGTPGSWRVITMQANLGLRI